MTLTWQPVVWLCLSIVLYSTNLCQAQNATYAIAVSSDADVVSGLAQWEVDRHTSYNTLLLLGQSRLQPPVRAWASQQAALYQFSAGTLKLANLYIEDVTLQPPASQHPLAPVVFNLSSSAVLQLENVTLVTSCDSLLEFQEAACSLQPTTITQVDCGWVYYQQVTIGTTRASSVNVTCSTYVDDPTTPCRSSCVAAAAATPADLKRSLLQLQPRMLDASTLCVSITKNISFSTAAWDSSGVNITRNVSISAPPGVLTALDLQLRTNLFTVQPGGNLTLSQLSLENPGLGICNTSVSCIFATGMWAVRRSPGAPLYLKDCNMSVSNDEYEYLAYWMTIRLSRVPETAAQAKWFDAYASTVELVPGVPQGVQLIKWYSATLHADQVKLINAQSVFPRLRNISGIGWILTPKYLGANTLMLASNCNTLADALLHPIPASNGNIAFTANISLQEVCPLWPAEGLTLSRTFSFVAFYEYTIFDVAQRRGVTLVNNAKILMYNMTIMNNAIAASTYEMALAVDQGFFALNLWFVTHNRAALNVGFSSVTMVVPQRELDLYKVLLSDDPLPDGPQQYMDSLQHMRNFLKSSQIASESATSINFPAFNGQGILGVNVTATSVVPTAFAGLPDPFLSLPTELDNESPRRLQSKYIIIAVVLSMIGALVLAACIVLLIRARRHGSRLPAGQPKLKSMMPSSSDGLPSTQPTSGSTGPVQPGTAEQDVEGQLGAASAIIAIPSHDSEGNEKRPTYPHEQPWSSSGEHHPVKELNDIAASMKQELLDNDLVLGPMLGSGGQGVVHHGVWRGLKVAVKILRLANGPNTSTSRRSAAMREAAICNSLHHPHIVALYAYDLKPIRTVTLHPARAAGSSSVSVLEPPVQEWKLYLIQELCSGGSLSSFIDEGQFNDHGNKPDMAKILHAAVGVASGMAHIHSKHIVHGDLNPNNVLLQYASDQPGLPIAKVADFGLSVKLRAHDGHMSNVRHGTLSYMAPEVLTQGHLTKAADVYAFGILMWELYHGTPPWRRKRAQGEPMTMGSLLLFAEDCPIEYRQLGTACISQTPEERPEFDQLVEKLTQLQRLIPESRTTPTTPSLNTPEISLVMGSIHSTPTGGERLRRWLMRGFGSEPKHQSGDANQPNDVPPLGPGTEPGAVARAAKGDVEARHVPLQLSEAEQMYTAVSRGPVS